MTLDQYRGELIVWLEQQKEEVKRQHELEIQKEERNVVRCAWLLGELGAYLRMIDKVEGAEDDD